MRHSPGGAFQCVVAAVGEREPRAHDEVLDGARYQHLPRPGHAGYAGADVHRNAPDVLVAEVDLPGVETRADLDPERAHVFAYRPGTVDAPRLSVECGQHAVAGGLH